MCWSRPCAKLSPLPHCLRLRVSGSGHARRCGPTGRLGSEGTGAREATLLCFSRKQNPHLSLRNEPANPLPLLPSAGESLFKPSPTRVRPMSLWRPDQPDPWPRVTMAQGIYMHKTLLRAEPQETERLACVKKVWGPQRPTQAKVGLILAPSRGSRSSERTRCKAGRSPWAWAVVRVSIKVPRSRIALPPTPQPPQESQLVPSKERNVAGIPALSNGSLWRQAGGDEGICRSLSSCFSPRMRTGPPPWAQPAASHRGRESQPCGPRASLSPR